MRGDLSVNIDDNVSLLSWDSICGKPQEEEEGAEQKDGRA